MGHAQTGSWGIMPNPDMPNTFVAQACAKSSSPLFLPVFCAVSTFLKLVDRVCALSLCCVRILQTIWMIQLVASAATTPVAAAI